MRQENGQGYEEPDKVPGHVGNCRACGVPVLMTLAESDLPPGEVVVGVLIFCKEHEYLLKKIDKRGDHEKKEDNINKE